MDMQGGASPSEHPDVASTMNAVAPLAVDSAEIAHFVDALFRYADSGTFVSLRAFRDDVGGVFEISAHSINPHLNTLIQAATQAAHRAANAPFPVTFCPPPATFNNPDKADEASLANGLVLSVECDSNPRVARTRLEGLLGPATLVVASGGEWLDPEKGEMQPKLHLHWRLTEPTREAADHGRLKQARQVAQRLVGADASNTPIVHPLRWPGSWHRKGSPRLARIVAMDDAREIELQDALDRLQEAAAAAGLHDHPKSGEGASMGAGEERETDELIRVVLTAEDYHAPLAALAMRYLKGGMADAQAVLTLRGLMNAVPPESRDLKDGSFQAGRWQARYDDIPRAVSSARAKLGERTEASAAAPGGDWPDPVDFLGDTELTGAPVLRPHHLPDALAPFVFDTAARMGVDPAAVALCAVVAAASVIPDDWRIQPRVHDDTWMESPRLWGAVVGDPSIMKTPVLKTATSPIERLDAEARDRHAEAMRKWREEMAAIKADRAPPGIGPLPPKLDRYLIEGTTVEALTEVLRRDDDAKQRAPSGKVLCRQDEMSGWLAGMDQYKAGGKGGADRAHYLTLFNGGRYVVDRIGRGTFAIPNWSACVLGGIQPEPIQRIAKDAADDGLLQRFLYCLPCGQGDGEDRRPDAAALARYRDLFPALATLRPSTGFVELAPEVKHRPVVFHAEAHRHREDINALLKAQGAMPDSSARLKAALAKWPGTFARLALTFHLINIADANARGEHPPVAAVLSEDTARRAAAYMREVLLPHLLRADALLFLTRQTGHARWIAGFILASDEAREKGRVTLRDIMRAYQPLRATEHRRELVEVLTTLELMGWLRAEPVKNAAKHPSGWHVNPKLHTTFAMAAQAERERRQRAQEEMREAILRYRAERGQ
ncbi:DUF3987 domain-containing protein [Roseococcus sp. SDR]|uniref:DUF3987 domain-containing protein n=1 Tax=Roseococcus sp. SDR TaxID=2835532 RepID=UPI001BD19E87|nr:DUF3987 domain-containing protein [Roseococcus sp. SDR]MBS7790082.1 DUF3987 domain-containing protein [Roseococcus sp. SDR]MBV1845396.1 DUF3987 domain-containing protein [Roseococcus sp. SDR]